MLISLIKTCRVLNFLSTFLSPSFVVEIIHFRKTSYMNNEAHCCISLLVLEAWFPYSRKDWVTIFLNANGQIMIVFTCKPHINHKYSLFLITLPIISVKLLYFGCWERAWLNFYDHYDNMETHITWNKQRLLSHQTYVNRVNKPIQSFPSEWFSCSLIIFVSLYTGWVKKNWHLCYSFEYQMYQFFLTHPVQLQQNWSLNTFCISIFCLLCEAK